MPLRKSLTFYYTVFETKTVTEPSDDDDERRDEQESKQVFD